MATIKAGLDSTGHAHPLWLGIHVDIRNAVAAGAAAGVIFLALELLATALLGERSPLGPAYVTLHGLTGAEFVPGVFNIGLALAAVFAHFALSMVLAIPLAALIHPWKDVVLASAVGAVFGIALYFINFHLLGIFLPALGSTRDAAMLVNYGVFGASVVMVYKLTRRREARSTV